MRPRAQSADEQRLALYRQTIDRYLRYVLIRSLAYTNDRTLVERIAAYTLITTCVLGRRLRDRGQMSLLIETMVEMVGDDQVTSDKRQVAGSQLEARYSALDTADARICEIARAVNGVGRAARELLVLRHVEGIDLAELAEIHGKSEKRMAAGLAEAEREFIGILRGMSSWNHEIEPDVHGLLTEFAARLNANWSENLGSFVLRYLAEHRW
jgi:DNA-directed RNA polymerase specialized sigma24 family protein